MKKALSQLIIGISAVSLTQPLSAVENEDELIPTPTTPAKKREFKYIYEVMKMTVTMRLKFDSENELVEGVSDQILKTAPYLLYNIKGPNDVDFLLRYVFKLNSPENHEIIKQALYKASGLELNVATTNPMIPTETVIEAQEIPVSEASIPTLHAPSNPIEETAEAPSELQLPQEPIRVESPMDIASVDVTLNVANTSLEAETTISHEVSSISELMALNHTAASLAQVDHQDFTDHIKMTTSVVAQTEEISEVESHEPSHEVSISYEGTPETQLESLKIESNQPHLTQLIKPERSEKTINFSIDLEFVSPGFNMTHSLKSSDIGECPGERVPSSKPSLSLSATNNLTLLNQEKFADTKLPIKSKARLHTKYDEFQLRATSTPSLLNHLGLAYLAGLMMILMSFVKDALGLRRRIQIAARPINHYQVVNLSDLPNWTFNLNNTNTNRKSGLKNLQKKS